VAGAASFRDGAFFFSTSGSSSLESAAFFISVSFASAFGWAFRCADSCFSRFAFLFFRGEEDPAGSSAFDSSFAASSSFRDSFVGGGGGGGTSAISFSSSRAGLRLLRLLDGV
jgi:hypothetical protein